MKKIALLTFLALSGMLARAQNLPFIKAEQIARWRATRNDTVYVLNFWATWCGPCVAELPAFQKLQQQYAGRKVKVVLISTDFKRQVEKAVKPFVRERHLESMAVFIDEPTANTWINSVSPAWSGAIPATLILGLPDKSKAGGTRPEWFYEGSLTYKKLRKALKKTM